ncbi:hypothetical protein ACQKP5_03820 [Pseudomonas vancouverensis]|uniref:hypothetical protein n=1 Tax=Pseudomonas vancouverensis TaxID=95300 RepID=UPI003CFBC493
MLDASTVAMSRTVETPVKTKQTQEKLIYTDQNFCLPAAIRRALIWLFGEQVNL